MRTVEIWHRPRCEHLASFRSVERPYASATLGGRPAADSRGKPS